MGDVINGAAATAYREIVGPEYRGNPNDSNDRPNKFRFDRFIDRGALCTDLISKAIEVRGEDDEGCEQYYDNLIFINKEAIDSCSWKYRYENGRKNWYNQSPEATLKSCLRDKDSATTVYCLQDAAHRRLYNMVNSNTVIGLTPGTEVSYGEAPWQTGLKIGWVVLAILELAGAAAIFSMWRKKED